MPAPSATFIAATVVDTFEALTHDITDPDDEAYLNVGVTWTNSHGRTIALNMSTMGAGDDDEDDVIGEPAPDLEVRA